MKRKNGFENGEVHLQIYNQRQLMDGFNFDIAL